MHYEFKMTAHNFNLKKQLGKFSRLLCKRNLRYLAIPADGARRVKEHCNLKFDHQMSPFTLRIAKDYTLDPFMSQSSKMFDKVVFPVYL